MRFLGRFSAAVAAAATLMTGLVVSSGTALAATPAPDTGGSPGYWLIGRNGQIFQFGTTNYGDLRSTALVKPIVGGAATPSGLGYWMVASDGGVFTYGNAAYHGSTGAIRLNRPIVGMAADPVTGGYWLVASDGGIFSFDAPYFGSMGGRPLVRPIVGIVPTPSGHGYWLVASDGGLFAFGDAGYYGSTGGLRLNHPVVGMGSSHDGRGYWLVASDGGIFTFGDARYYGSTGSIRLNAPVVGMSASPTGLGYWMVASDGGVFRFGDAPFLGSAQTGGAPAIVGMASTDSGFPFPPGSTGYDVSKYQCTSYPGHVSGLPPSGAQVAVVQVSGGAINLAQSTQCYDSEAAWAGPNMSAYIFMDTLPSPAPPESKYGPAGSCAASDTNCEAYNFGYNWAQHWVAYAHANGTHPTLWWLDVETTGTWDYSSAGQVKNSHVIQGAVAGLRANSVMPGIYATNYQWGQITGYHVSFPHIPLWVPGAGNVSSPTPDALSATQICALPPGPEYPTTPSTQHAPFAGGTTVLVQYGYGKYAAPHTWDEDYACK